VSAQWKPRVPAPASDPDDRLLHSSHWIVLPLVWRSARASELRQNLGTDGILRHDRRDIVRIDFQPRRFNVICRWMAGRKA